MARITFEQKIQFHTERFIEGLREGKTVSSMITDIIGDSALWGSENVKANEANEANVKNKRQASS